MLPNADVWKSRPALRMHKIDALVLITQFPSLIDEPFQSEAHRVLDLPGCELDNRSL